MSKTEEAFHQIAPKISQFHEGELGLAFYLNSDGYAYTVYDSEKGEQLAYVQQPCSRKDLEAALKKEELLEFDYAQYRLLLFENVQSTLVPDKIFTEDLLQKYVNLNWQFDESKQTVITESLDALNCQLISLADQAEYTLLKKLFPKGEIITPYHVFIKAFSKLAALDKKHKHQVFANIEKEHFDLFVFERQRLIFANRFKYSSNEDFIYFFLHVINRLKIDSGDIIFQICGTPEKDLIEVIEHYVMRTVMLNTLPVETSLRLPVTRDYALLNIASVCAL